MFRIYLVEDELNLNQILTSYLQKEGWGVKSFLEGETALEAIAEHPHVWILDIMLPDIDGYHLLRQIKAESPDVPIIFISARDNDLDRIMGLEMGSDDYLPKPFLPRELVIRTRRLLERVYPQNEPKNHVFDLYPYIIDKSRRLVKKGPQIINLTAKEFDLTLLLAKHTGQALSREQIISHV